MKRTVYLLSYLQIFAAFTVHGQINEREPEYSLGVHWGVNQVQAQDQVYSPLIYGGVSMTAFQAFFDRSSSQNFFQIFIGYDRQFVDSGVLPSYRLFGSRLTRKESISTFGNFRLGYARRLAGGSRYELFVGGLSDNQIHLLEYQFAQSPDDSYLLVYAFSLWGRLGIPINASNAIVLESAIPLAQFASRPPYAVVDNEEIQSANSGFSHIQKRGKFEIFNNFLKLNLTTSYKRKLSPRLALLIAHQFAYLRYSKPLQISILKNHLNVGLSFTF